MQIFSLSEGSGENLNPKKRVEHDVPVQFNQLSHPSVIRYHNLQAMS